MNARTVAYPRPKREAPPEPIFRGPDCALCDTEMYHDGDSFRCDTCGYSWDNGVGTWNEETEPQCAAVLQPHKDADPDRYARIIGFTERCTLGAYHALESAPAKPENWWEPQPADPRQHRSGNHEWNDGDAREVTPRLTDERLHAMRDGIDRLAERAMTQQRAREAERHRRWREDNPEAAARIDAERAESERRWAEARAARAAGGAA